MDGQAVRDSLCLLLLVFLLLGVQRFGVSDGVITCRPCMGVSTANAIVGLLLTASTRTTDSIYCLGEERNR